MGLTLTLLVGLPASGKSTAAAVAQVKNPNTVVVCMDDLRAMLHGARPHGAVDEQLTTAVRDRTIVVAAEQGRDVIVADTNLILSTREHLQQIGERCGMQVIVDDRFLGVPVEECVARDAAREHPVGSAVILAMDAALDYMR